MALESVQDLGTPVALRDVAFPEALRFPLGGSRTLRLTASASQFRFASLRDEAKPFAEASWTTHCSGSFDNAQPIAAMDLSELQARLNEEQERNTDAGFDIGPSFRWTKGVRLAANECRRQQQDRRKRERRPFHRSSPRDGPASAFAFHGFGGQESRTLP